LGVSRSFVVPDPLSRISTMTAPSPATPITRTFEDLPQLRERNDREVVLLGEYGSSSLSKVPSTLRRAVRFVMRHFKM
jgi:hypothetical protein